MITYTAARYSGNLVYREGVCLSTDTKPTNDASMMNGSTLEEMDTGKKYVYDAENTTWREDTSGGGGSGSGVSDVQVNGTSVVSNGVANVPIATDETNGVVSAAQNRGIMVLIGENAGKLAISSATEADVKGGNNAYKPIIPYNQHQSAFYGLAKAAGDTTQSASNNAVGTYTADALFKIQKMLGIYEAPWELIREDTFTNATESDYTISVDGDGESFEITDIRMIIWFPTQNNEAKSTDGRIYYYYGESSYISTSTESKTQAANAAENVAFGIVEQSKGMIYLYGSSWNTRGNNTPVRTLATYDKTAITYPFFTTNQEIAFNRITLKKITGTMSYRLYGKRKWTV